MAMQALKCKSESNGDGVHCMLLLPGWVRTDMGGQNARKSAQEAVREMLGVIGNYASLKNGGFYSYEGKEYPW